MNILTETYWKAFKSDGKLFEELVGDLLHAEYPEYNFEHTRWSHDGGKDFSGYRSFFDKKEKVWAECKYHKSKLPIHDVSMSLFMAYVESAHAIIFFSYSPVNREFQKYIDLYEKKSEKIVKIFDDIALEELILRHKNSIPFNKYFDFDGILGDAFHISEPVTVNYWMSEGPIHNDSPVFHVNDIAQFEVSLFNHTSTTISAKVYLYFNKNSKCFKILNRDSSNNTCKEIIIQPNSLNGISYILQLEKYANSPSFPTVKVELSCSDKAIKKRIGKKPSCRWLAETPLIGDDNHRFLETSDLFLNTESGSFIGISGHSGSGKSRMVKEICIRAKAIGYETVTFDADINSSLSIQDFLKKMISTVEDIPNLSLISKNAKNKILTDVNISKVPLCVIRVLQNEPFNNIDLNDITSYLVEKMLEKHIFLALDNIQFYDEKILEIIRIIIEKRFFDGKFVILLTINTDYVLNDTIAKRLITELKRLSFFAKHNVLYKEMLDLSTKDACHYLKICLGNNSKTFLNYTDTLSSVLSKYGTNPFYLQNYLLYLYQLGIIDKSRSGSFYICDVESFQESLLNIPESINELLSCREDFFIKKYIQSDNLQYEYGLLMTYMSFLRWTPKKVAIKLCQNARCLINELLTIGILKENDNHCFGFSHQLIEEYYINKYSYVNLSEPEMQSLCSVLENDYQKEQYVERIFLLKYNLHKVDNTSFNNIKNKILNSDIDYKITYDVCKAVDALIMSSFF